MRIDLVSIFPDYFAALDLSLMGKAKEVGLLDVHVHDLRRWTHDRHHSVDAPPFGGGAGMVMRPDVWGEALDEVLGHRYIDVESEPVDSGDDTARQGQRQVLAIPTPSGRPLTQSIARELAQVDHLVVACGRYEGIDQRVADYYRDCEIEVLEYSIGDYVLNGGEVAALVLVEAVARLLDGVLGNPDSLREESYEDGGLLEYPAYTRPRSWRGAEVPQVLLGGDHGAIATWRRDRSLVRTAHRRPDLLDEIDPTTLSIHDHEVLAGAGQVLRPTREKLLIRQGRTDEAEEIAALAAETFPDACPQHIPTAAVEAFIAEHLTVDVFRAMLSDPKDYRILVARTGGGKGPIVGYTLTIVGGPEGIAPDLVRPGKIERDGAYLSKCYVSRQWRGSGIAGALLERAVADVVAQGRNSQIVLGTNVGNKRAIRFYRRHGFKVVSRRHFDVGGVHNIDEVLVRNLTPHSR